MPLSSNPITKRKKKKKPESTQSNMANNTSSHVMPDEFAELLWDDGPMNRKSSFPTPFPAFNARAQDKRSKDVASFPKIIGNGFPSLGHSDDTGLNAGDDDDDDDTVPWISQDPHPVQDSLQNNDFFSDFLNDLSLHSMPAAPAAILSSGQHTSMEQGHNNASEPGRVRTAQLFRSPKQCQISAPNTKLEETSVGVGSGSKAHQHSIRSRFQKPPTVGSKPTQPSGSTSVINFSHFSRLAALARANLQTADGLRSNDKASTAASTNPKESTQVIDSAGGLNMSTASGAAAVPASAPFRKNSRTAPDDSSSFRASTVPLVRNEPTRVHPAAAASSSVSSGADLKHGEKRKHRQGDDSGHHSEDLEDDWVGCKKPPTQMKGTGAKRSRAAQVHNLSERRRRDRINEKMRALQELIPNSNKTDKASMLDEAIEYLKTLQLQLQMMSMGSGLCMPPMMMQHTRAPAMAHYSPMGLEMGMYEMNGSPGRCPMMIPVPPMQGPHFSPCPSIPGLQGLHRMPGTPNLQMYGIPGHGFHPLVPHQPPPAVFESGTTASPLPALSFKDQQQ